MEPINEEQCKKLAETDEGEEPSIVSGREVRAAQG